MLFYVGKALRYLFAPFTLSLVVLAVAVLAGVRGQTRSVFRCCVAALSLLVLGSFPIFSESLMHWLEMRHPPLTFASAPQVGAIVVAGGTVLRLRSPRRNPEELGSRVIPAVQLFRLGKATNVLVSGGIPYLDEDGQTRTEASDMRDVLTIYGVPLPAIWLEGESRNTHENAVYSCKILRDKGVQKVLLVTSAFHMARAMTLFRRECGSIEITAFPTEFRVDSDHLEWKDLLPDLASLEMTTVFMTEMVGKLVYQ